MILPCSCTRDSRGNTRGAQFQDETYGRGLRVHNEAKAADPVRDQRWRCTVCGAETIRPKAGS